MALLVDTSVIIDGRILDISQTGFIQGALLVPRFVLNELQHVADSAEVLRGDAFALLEAPTRRTYDYIYIAPPQYKGMWKRALLALDAHPERLAEDGWAIVQIHPLEYDQDGGSGGLQTLVEFDQRRYGSTLVVFYSRK